jgi:glucose-1-phosphate thymidylyltransferase
VTLKTLIVVGGEAAAQGRPRHAATLTALEPVANRPIVHHVLDWLRHESDGGFIFAGDADSLLELRSGLSEYSPSLDHVEYVVSDWRAGVAGAIAAAAPLVGDAACLIQPADGMLAEPVLPLVEMLDREESDLLLLVSPHHGHGDPWTASGVGTEISADRGQVVDAGLFAPGALGRVVSPARPVGNDLVTAGMRLAAEGGSVYRHPMDGWCRYRGHGADLLELNRVALDRVVRSVPPAIAEQNRIEGNVRIDPTASVRSSVIVGPTVIGPGATVSDAYIGPYTSVGAGARIIGTEIERSIVSPGASVLHIGSRLTASLVGRGARVFRDFSLPRALRLWVSEGDDVALC